MARTKLLVFLGTLALSTALALSCGDDSPSAPTAITAAPAIVTPAAGSTVESRNPTLTVSNVSVSAGTPKYHFQVANDSSFASIVVEGRGVAQGASQTSWQVTTPLENESYFWRAKIGRAHV